MVCAKCQRTIKQTTLATPAVKRKSEMYHGSIAGDKKASGTTSSSIIGKSKLLSKGAKNPYAAYSMSCETCKTKIEQGHRFCQRCAYKAGNACSVCGKSQTHTGTFGAATLTGPTRRGPVVMGQKFSAK